PAWPAVSVARAVSKWAASGTVVVSHSIAQPSAPSASTPMLAPSTRNSTCVTPASSLASAVRVTTPDTRLPSTGAVSATVGSASAGGTGSGGAGGSGVPGGGAGSPGSGPGTMRGANRLVLLMSSSGSWMPSPESSVQSKLPALIRISRIFAGGYSPLAASTAAAPATCGEAILEPLSVPVEPCSSGYVERMQVPGAASVTAAPKLLYQANVSSWSSSQVGAPCPPGSPSKSEIAETAITSGWFAGLLREASCPSLPAETTNVTPAATALASASSCARLAQSTQPMLMFATSISPAFAAT